MKITIRREGYYRKAYRRKDGTMVEAASVNPSVFQIMDRGAPGRGKKVIPPLQKGELTKHGYHISSSVSIRRLALAKSVNEDGYRTTIGRLIALRVFFKRTKRSSIPILKSDIAWLKREYGDHW